MRSRAGLLACLPVPMNLQPAPSLKLWDLQINAIPHNPPPTDLTPDSCPCKHSSDFLP